ncbi:MAG: hypothetical protein Q4B17_00615 [Lautropia sp.]|nr:hypothetical protein [Lautropia sp.]
MDLMPLGVRPWIFIGLVYAALMGLFYLVARIKRASLGKTGWGMALVLLPVLIAMFGLVQSRSLSINEGVLRIKSTHYTKDVPLADISRVDLYADCQPRLSIQANGMGIPGIVSGWYRDGAQKYFVDFVRKPNVCIVSGNTPDIVVLEVSDPQLLKNRLLSGRQDRS